jgi:hypothetical protein
MPPILPFRLKVPGTDRFENFEAVSTSFRFRGHLGFDGDLLIISWAGVARVQEVGILTVRDDQLPLPCEEITVPVSHLARAGLDGGWWRPRVRLQAKVSGTLSLIPSEAAGTVQFWLSRRDRRAAGALVAVLEEAIATVTDTEGRALGPSNSDKPFDTPRSGLTTA